MLTRRRHSAYQPAAWLAVLAILLQVLLPLGNAPARTAPIQHGDTIAGFDIAQNLCHAPGDTTPDDQSPVDHQQCCDFCLAVHAVAGFTPPSGPAIALDRDYGLFLPTESALVLPRQRADLTRQQPRAPPAFI